MPAPSPSEAIVHAMRGSREAEEAVGMHIGHPECADIPTGYIKRPDGSLVSAVDAAREAFTETETITVKATVDTTRKVGDGPEERMHEEIAVETMTMARKLAISGIEMTAEGPQSTIKPEAADGQRGI